MITEQEQKKVKSLVRVAALVESLSEAVMGLIWDDVDKR